VERARVTRILAKIKEDEGNVNDAADIMQDLQVLCETVHGIGLPTPASS
jgi:hypothetical protein